MELFGEGIAWLADPANWTHPRNGIFLRLWEHVSLSAVAFAVAAAIALPIGLVIGHTGRGAAAVIAVANIGRAVPSVGWLGIVFAPLLLLFGRGGLGFAPSVIALILLGIPPMVTNTYAACGRSTGTWWRRDGAWACASHRSCVRSRSRLRCR